MIQYIVTKLNRRRYRHRNYLIYLFICSILIIVSGFILIRAPECHRRSTSKMTDLHLSFVQETIISQPWRIPDWVQRYNVTHLFDWTWYKNSDFLRCRGSIPQPKYSSACRATTAKVVNDPVIYFRSHPDEGCIVDNVARLPNLIPHPLPRVRSMNETCSSLHIDRLWTLCNKPQSELDNWFPATKRLVTVAIFNAFVDTGHCHPNAPGTVFNERVTFHLQRSTDASCGNDVIFNIPSIKEEYRHKELINSLGNYLQAPGHFAPQQLPRLLRLLATAPTTAKVLVAKGGVASLLIDVLIERGIVTRDRIVPFDDQKQPYHFANIIYRTESWPYRMRNMPHVHERTDMHLVRQALTADDSSSTMERDLIILIKRKDKISRSIIEHADLAAFMNFALNKSEVSRQFRVEIFDARGHVREHIALFRRARVIVGPHGAGMSNMLWASARTHVVEIGYTTGMTFPEMYAEMSLHLDQHYWICKGYGDYGSPIHVDMEDFIDIFRQILRELENECRTV